MTLEDELAHLDLRIRQLRIQFDLFFSGALPKPPLEARDDLDKAVKRAGNLRDMKLAQRFLYNTLLNRWNIFTELWNKRLQAKEEGARVPAAARRRVAAEPAAPPPEQDAAEAGKPKPAERRLVARAAVRDAADSSGELQAFYKSFLEARQEAGGGKSPSYERFCKEIERQAAVIRERSSCERVDFRLYLENNKVSLKAKPLKEEEKESRG